MRLYIDAWKLGVKAIAIYRDNCKVAQPLSGKSGGSAAASPMFAGVVAPQPQRRRLPDDRVEVGRKFKVGDYEGYIHVGLFEDGTPGDIFVDIAKEGTTLAGLMNSFMISVSLGIQYGVPLEVYVSKFSHMRFEPSGLTNDADIRVAKSIVDYIFRWMGKKFLTADQQEEAGILSPEVTRPDRRALRERRHDGRAVRGRARPAAARRRCSTRGRTQSSAPSAAAGWSARAAATRAATAGLTRAAVRSRGHRKSGLPDFRTRMIKASMILSPLVRSRAGDEVARIKSEALVLFGDRDGGLDTEAVANPPKAERRKPKAIEVESSGEATMPTWPATEPEAKNDESDSPGARRKPFPDRRTTSRRPAARPRSPARAAPRRSTASLISPERRSSTTAARSASSSSRRRRRDARTRFSRL